MMAIFVATVMILSALVIAFPGMVGREYGMNPAATSSANIQPNPTLNTNVSWSVFNHGWSPLEYSNGSANLSLNAQPSALYPNYISVNPADIQANGTLTHDKLGSMTTAWDNLSWVDYSGTGSSASITTLPNGEIQIKDNTSTTVSVGATYGLYIYTSCFPSNNPQYDYLTIIAGLSGPAMTGVSASIEVWNESASAGFIGTMYPGQTSYLSENLATLQEKDGYGSTFNTSGKGATSRLEIYPGMGLPSSSTTETYTFTIYGIAFTDYALTLGQNATGATISQSGTHALLSSFAPSFPWTGVTGDGYTAAISQPLQNLTTQQSAINTLNYIEQVEYQGQFNLPTAPDLTYGSANITEHFNVSTSQTQVLDINGVSYLSTISGKNNTVLLLSSVNPNGQTQFLQIVDYTQSQWTSISSPPGIFSLAGIEYYWEEFIIAILAIVGVGAGAASRHASNLRKAK